MYFVAVHFPAAVYVRRDATTTNPFLILFYYIVCGGKGDGGAGPHVVTFWPTQRSSVPGNTANRTKNLRAKNKMK